MPNQETTFSQHCFGTILYLPIGYLCDLLNKLFNDFMYNLALICAHTFYVSINFDKFIYYFLMFGFLAGVKLPKWLF